MKIQFRESYTRGDWDTTELGNFLAVRMTEDVVGQGQIETIESNLNATGHFIGSLVELLVERGIVTVEDIGAILPGYGHELRAMRGAGSEAPSD